MKPEQVKAKLDAAADAYAAAAAAAYAAATAADAYAAATADAYAKIKKPKGNRRHLPEIPQMP